MLEDAGIAVLADVRSVPHSRRWPQYDRHALARSLSAAGVAYRHLPALGGRRADRSLGASSPNGAWDEPAFRHYADYALSPPFRQGIADLLALAEEARTAVMCAEADWRHCHRRIVTDHLLAAGHEVLHLTAPGAVMPAVMTPGAVVAAQGQVTYPPIQGDLF